MNIPLQVTYRGVDKTESIDRLIREKTALLDRHHDGLSSCRVAVEKPNRPDEPGSGWRVRLDLTVPPRHELVIVEEANKGDQLAHVIQLAYDRADRQLRKEGERLREVRGVSTGLEANGFVQQLFDDHGFLRDLAGREIYFHRHSVLNATFRELTVGTPVHYSEEQGEQGPQASSLHVLSDQSVLPLRQP